MFREGNTGLVVSGGNIDMRVLASVLLRGLVHGGQLVRLRIQITDAPGNLAQVTRIIGEAGGNIVEIVHQRLFYDVPVKQTDIDVVIETRNGSHAGEIKENSKFPDGRPSPSAILPLCRHPKRLINHSQAM